MELVLAQTTEQLSVVRQLFEEYERGLGISLCFQNFEEELATLPGAYASPSGVLLLATENSKAAGCVALRPMNKADHGAAEMKRLFVRSDFRGKGVARTLVLDVLKRASEIGYKTICLDTLKTMKEAHALYAMLGFEEIPPYYKNPMEGVRYMKMDLHKTGLFKQ